MLPYEMMDDDERGDFLIDALRILSATYEQRGLDKALKPAMVAIWMLSRERSVFNMWQHWDIDQETCIDEAVRNGVQFFENLIAMSNDRDPPPEITPAMLADMRMRAVNTTKILRAPKYRGVIAALFEDFFEDQREQGNL